MGFMIPAVMKKKLRPSFGTLRFMVVLIAVVLPAFFASHGNAQCLNPSPELLFYREITTAPANVVLPYIPPTPIAGRHRYILLLYEQTNCSFFPPAPGRILFSAEAFVSRYGLIGPVAGIYFGVTAGE
ncbi:unnamed protein product [Sphagnum jensenii]|uniref:Uncharacterized protein n=1 Tax=Sphagnum jensenii TaxID=128206 RepID=A0ABP1AY13_9BRYO